MFMECLYYFVVIVCYYEEDNVYRIATRLVVPNLQVISLLVNVSLYSYVYQRDNSGGMRVQGCTDAL